MYLKDLSLLFVSKINKIKEFQERLIFYLHYISLINELGLCT